MKKILILIISLLLFVPFKVYGLTVDKYHDINLKQALEMEGMDNKVENVEYDNPVVVYLFMGDGCPHCKEFLNYASTKLVDTYGGKVIFSIYEVWNNSDNEELYNKVRNYFDIQSTGVPLIVIGDDYYMGYASNMDSDIENAIEKEYAKTDRFDALKEALKIKEDKVDFLYRNGYEYSTFKESMNGNDTSKNELLYNKDKFNVYVFRGEGCSHCAAFLSYANEVLVDKYHDKINIISFEVWNDEKNKALMEKVGKKLDADTSGVPFIVIGNKVINGYAESFNKEIEDTIDAQYEEKIDIVKDIVEAKEKEKKEEKNIKNILPALYIGALFFVIFIVTAIVAVVLKTM